MQIEINKYRKVQAIQQEFNGFFPNMNLMFYEKPHTLGGPHSDKLVKRGSKILSECRNVHNEGVITIQPGENVGELKQNFSDVYSLAVDVFKKTGNTHTDGSPVADNNILEQLNKELEATKSSKK